MDRTGVVRVLDQVASLLELKGENPFRVRAFRTAARTISSGTGDLTFALDDGSLAAARGIGPAILQIVTDLVKHDRSRVFEELRDEVPPVLLEMLAISGLGVAKVRLIHQELGIDTLTELEDAAGDGRLAKLPGFGQRSAENVLRGLAFLRRQNSTLLVHHAAREAEEARAALSRLTGVSRAIVAGDVRRGAEVARDIVVVLVAEESPAKVLERLAALPGVDELAGQDERRATLRFAGGSLVQVVVTPPVNAGAVLVEATGSPSHLAELQGYAASKGITLRGAALWRGSEFVATPDERAVYAALGLPEIPPELREGTGEAARAAQGLPRLLEAGDIKGFLHCHTTYSDGTNTIEEIATACAGAGYQYVGITDHSRSSQYAGGLRVEDLERQWAEVDAVNAALPAICVLKGIEVDILEDGTLDYGEEVLRHFDFVIASVHARYAQGEREMTTRLLRALDNPRMTIMGHPTGRMFHQREPFAFDHAAVFTRAGERGVALAINADPHRLDLDWRLLPIARDAGAMISIGADAHNTAGLEHMAWGIAQARKAWLGPEQILNTRTAT
ncbi:MAG TPA: PHP domain-containing protein, partial [Gemmatimonadales bacterium]|nr:PHP domain-containing protein [Gemmatimonadales bacterium]